MFTLLITVNYYSFSTTSISTTSVQFNTYEEAEFAYNELLKKSDQSYSYRVVKLYPYEQEYVVDVTIESGKSGREYSLHPKVTAFSETEALKKVDAMIQEGGDIVKKSCIVSY